MRRLLPLIFILLLLGSAASCRRHRTVHPYGWTPLGQPFDSLTIAAERLVYNHGDADSLSILAAEMTARAAAHPTDRLMHQRASFWNAKATMARGQWDEGVEQLESLLATVDSASTPYDYNRILWTLDMEWHEPSFEYYEELQRKLRFFLSAGEYPIAAGVAMEMGGFLIDIAEADGAERYLTMADSLFAIAGMELQISNNRLNHANAIRASRDSLRAVGILWELARDTVNPLSPDALDIVYGNIYAIDGDTTALRRGYLLQQQFPRGDEDKCLYENFLAHEKYLVGDLDSAFYYHRLATSHLPGVERPDILQEYYRVRQELFASTGQVDSAFKYLNLYATVTDSIARSDVEDQIRTASLRHQIEMVQAQADINRRNGWIINICIIFLIIVAGGIATLVVWRRMQRQRLRNMQDQLKLERSNRRMLAMQMVLTEKDRLIQSVEQEMATASADGHLSTATASKVTSTLKAHTAANADREGFMETFENADPQFISSIRQAHPSLTDADIRLASFIALGVDNKHIARMMGVRHESVKQARWRLRQKLSLEQGASLDEYIKRFQTSPTL